MALQFIWTNGLFSALAAVVDEASQHVLAEPDYPG
jgi:hypothetical protein